MSSTGQQWVISPGNNQGVQLYGTDLCLDAQSNPEAGRLVLVYPCIGTNPQTWVSTASKIVAGYSKTFALQYLTPDDRIAITGGTQCLSVAGSNAETQRCGPSIDAQVRQPRECRAIQSDTLHRLSILPSCSIPPAVVLQAQPRVPRAVSEAEVSVPSLAQSHQLHLPLHQRVHRLHRKHPVPSAAERMLSRLKSRPRSLLLHRVHRVLSVSRTLSLKKAT